jgi:hypothetical protein
VYPVKKAFDAAAVDAALGSRHNRPSKAAAHAVAVSAPGGPGQGQEDTPLAAMHPLPVESPPDLQPFPRDERHIIDSLPPIELVHALFRKTKMGSFFNNPVDPPEFLSLAFPLPEDLRCVGCVPPNVPNLPVPSLPDLLALDHGH